MATYVVRRGRAADGPGFLRLVDELATFERLPKPFPAARRRLLRDAFGRRPRFELLVATRRGTPDVVAYAILLWTYSSFLAKPTLYLEDLYLSPAHRGTGLARQMMASVARRAKKGRAGRIEGIVLEWNERARRFYRRSGAQELADWIFFRYDEQALGRLARANP